MYGKGVLQTVLYRVGKFFSVNIGTFFIFCKGLNGRVNITVYLPTADIFTTARSVFDKTENVFGWISQKQTDFVRKVVLFVQTSGKSRNAIIGIFCGIAAVARNADGGFVIKVKADPRRTKKYISAFVPL